MKIYEWKRSGLTGPMTISIIRFFFNLPRMRAMRRTTMFRQLSLPKRGCSIFWKFYLRSDMCDILNAMYICVYIHMCILATECIYLAIWEIRARSLFVFYFLVRLPYVDMCVSRTAFSLHPKSYFHFHFHSYSHSLRLNELQNVQNVQAETIKTSQTLFMIDSMR